MQHIDLTEVSLCQDNSGELGGREPSRFGQAKLTDERYQPDVSADLNGEVRGYHDGSSPLEGEDNTPAAARVLAKVAAPQHPPTGMALMQDGALNLAFVANALRFYANHIEGHPQRGDYFPADLRLAAQMLVAGAPPPSTDVRVTDQQVETALITWFKNEVSWDKGMAPWSAEQFRVEMRATLEAALATAEGKEG